MIKDIIKQFSSRFKIIAAGGITDENLNLVHSCIDSTEYHGKRIVGQLPSMKEYELDLNVGEDYEKISIIIYHNYNGMLSSISYSGGRCKAPNITGRGKTIS